MFSAHKASKSLHPRVLVELMLAVYPGNNDGRCIRVVHFSMHDSPTWGSHGDLHSRGPFHLVSHLESHLLCSAHCHDELLVAICVMRTCHIAPVAPATCFAGV